MNVTEANSSKAWAKLWSRPEATDWRGDVLAPVYQRIAELMPPKSSVIDVGGGVGMLAERLHGAGHTVEVWEHNATALEACKRKGIAARHVDAESNSPEIPDGSAVVATEVLEHLSEEALHNLMSRAAVGSGPRFFSVPNDRLGPDEETQHARSWTAIEFKRFLSTYFADVRVEVLGPRAEPGAFASHRGQPAFLLGICGMAKAAELSVCFPARDEAADIETCLASYRGVADELIVGIDPRTKDATREIAAKYADVVFDIAELNGPPDDLTPEGGFHFAHARNQCMARCTSPWIFMTEAHEPLVAGHDALLHLEQVPEAAQVIHVVRQGGQPPHREQWLFPWLCRNRSDIRYARSTHNTLSYPDDILAVSLPQVKTLHSRTHTATVARKAQRAVQNRVKLMADWISTGNTWSLQYLGSEWLDYDSDRAVRYLREYLIVGKFGTFRYNTRLVLAKTLAESGKLDEAREALHGAEADDWTRSEHWVYLGDIAFEDERFEEALSFYEYAATKIGKAPLTTMWVDLAMYTWLPAQRLVQAHAELGHLDEALKWADRVYWDFLGVEDAPQAMVDEARANVRLLEDAIHDREERSCAA